MVVWNLSFFTFTPPPPTLSLSLKFHGITIWLLEKKTSFDTRNKFTLMYKNWVTCYSSMFVFVFGTMRAPSIAMFTSLCVAWCLIHTMYLHPLSWSLHMFEMTHLWQYLWDPCVWRDPPHPHVATESAAPDVPWRGTPEWHFLLPALWCPNSSLHHWCLGALKHWGTAI